MNHVIRHDVDEIRYYCTTVHGCSELLFCWKLVGVYRLIGFVSGCMWRSVQPKSIIS